MKVPEMTGRIFSLETEKNQLEQKLRVIERSQQEIREKLGLSEDYSSQAVSELNIGLSELINISDDATFGSMRDEYEEIAIKEKEDLNKIDEKMQLAFDDVERKLSLLEEKRVEYLERITSINDDINNISEQLLKVFTGGKNGTY